MKIPKQILERRRCIRVDAELPFRIQHEGFELEASTVNISSSGALCRLEKPVPVMTRLRIALTLTASNSNQKKSLFLNGVVVRKEADPERGGFLIAVYFADVNSSDQKRLDDFVRRSAKL